LSELIQAIILAVVQGATEFIPISSSAHLVVVPWLFGWPASTLLFDTMLHWGTLLSLLLIYGRELWAIAVAFLRNLAGGAPFCPEARLGWYLILGTIPAAAAGLYFKSYLESLYADPTAVGWQLIITAGLLAGSELLAQRLHNWHNLEGLRIPGVLWIGVAQAFSLIPGISRSGATIAAALTTGLRREDAARFCFLLGVPVFFGAGLLEVVEATAADHQRFLAEAPLLLAGFAVSAVTGYFAIRFLLDYLRQHSLYLFAVYCLCAGLAVILLSALRGG
jgi:undecaprenyl-diphosphatase